MSEVSSLSDLLERPDLLGASPDELRERCMALGLPRYAGAQVASWLYRRGASSFDAMTDLSRAARERLGATCRIGLSAPLHVDCSADGTKKYLYRTDRGALIESAYIPDGDRATLCVSSEAGCALRCRFCMTGRQGLHHRLTAGGILNQIFSLPERDRLTNLVYMGMGEPLDNPDAVLRSLEVLTAPWGWGWSPGRITLSTVGVIPALERFLAESRVHLAVSLHSPFPEERATIMPAERAWPIREVIALLKRHDFSGQRRLSFEYIVFGGLNDSPAHIKGLTRLLAGLRCRINLIRFHSVPDSDLRGASAEHMIAFRDELTRRGIQTTIRASRGEDIRAACGLLSTLEQQARAVPKP